MLRLDLLGAVDLRDAHGRSLSSDVGGNKHLALLIYLLLEGAHRPVRRDKVAGLLWPDSTQPRQSLSQALYKLRAALGDVVISGGNEELSVDRDLITSDSLEFAELVKRGELQQAVALYRGDVADGLNIRDLEFEQWLTSQRATWRASVAGVLEKLFNAAIEADDPTRAIDAAEKLLRVAPEKDQPVRQLITLLIARGQPAAAKRLYDSYERALAEQLDTLPPRDITTLIAELPQGRRAARASHSTPFAVSQPETQRRGSLITALTAVAVIVAVVLGGRYFNTSRSAVTAYPGTSPKIAVLPFAYGDQTQRSASVLNEALQWRLRSVGFEVLNAGTQDSSALRRLLDSNDDNGVTFVVGGDVAAQPDGSLAARLWLNDAGSGKRIWHSRFTQPASDAHLIATHLSDAVAAQIRKAAGHVLELTSGADDVSAEAWKDVYRAREHIHAAVDMRSQGAARGSAVELNDAALALARATTRERDWALPWVLRARIAEERAFSALIMGDMRQGAAELDRGIRTLDSVATRLESPDVYEMRGMLASRRFNFGVADVDAANQLLARAEADLRKALAPGREPSGAYTALSHVMFNQGKYAEAVVYAQRAYASNVFLRNNEDVLVRLFLSALHAGDDAAADSWCKELQKAMPRQWPAVLCRIHLAGFAPQLVDVATLESDIANLSAPPAVREAMVPRLKAGYAITLAQVGKADSARAVLASLADHKDPELWSFRAFALTALHAEAQARAALDSYLAENRGTRSMVLPMRWLHQGQTHAPLMK